MTAVCHACGSEHEPLLPTTPGASMCSTCKREATLLLTAATIDERAVERAEKERSE